MEVAFKTPWEGRALYSTTCEQIVKKMWEPQHLTNIWASMACYKYIFCTTSSQNDFAGPVFKASGQCFHFLATTPSLSYFYHVFTAFTGYILLQHTVSICLLIE
jgi:hypothetical protein